MQTVVQKKINNTIVSRFLTERFRVRITFTEPVLGGQPSDPDIHEEYIASNAPDAPTMKEEVAEHGVEEMVEKGKTIFPKLEDGTPILYNYQVEGFFKSSQEMLNRLDKSGKKGYKLQAYKKVIDQTIKVAERHIPLIIPDGYGMGDCQRPLRAQTAQGDRVALANSEELPEGTTCEFTICYGDPKMRDYIINWLDCGATTGIGQWRNSGKGRFTWDEVLEVSDNE